MNWIPTGQHGRASHSTLRRQLSKLLKEEQTSPLCKSAAVWHRPCVLLHVWREVRMGPWD